MNTGHHRKLKSAPRFKNRNAGRGVRYTSNGVRECARRRRQAARIAVKQHMGG